MSTPLHCRVLGCDGTDTSRLRICDRHFQMLPKDIRSRLTRALNTTRVLPDVQRGRVLAPVLDKALAWIEANESAPDLFGEEL
jgi:hypothetical protein